MAKKALAVVSDSQAIDRLLPVQPPARLLRPNLADRHLTRQAVIDSFRQGKVKAQDIKILKTVWALGAVTSPQIRRLFFHTSNTAVSGQNLANRRLNFLYKNYYLNRTYFGSRYTYPVYYLDLQGGRLLQFIQEAERSHHFRVQKRETDKIIFFIAHRLEVTEFVVSLMESLRQEQGSLTWLGETTLSLKLTDKQSFEPDGLGLLRWDGANQAPQTLPIFLEWDRNTEPIEAVAAKLRHYNLFRHMDEGKRWQHLLREAFTLPWSSMRYPLIIFITTGGTSRLERMLKTFPTTFQRLQVTPQHMPVWITSLQVIEQQGPSSPCFYPLGQATPADLVWLKGLRSFKDAVRPNR